MSEIKVTFPTRAHVNQINHVCAHPVELWLLRFCTLTPGIILGHINSEHRRTLEMIPGILLGARREDHAVNEYAEQDDGEVRGLGGRAAGTRANISAYNDVTSILHHWTTLC